MSFARFATRDVAELVAYVVSNSGRVEDDEVGNAIDQTILTPDRNRHRGPVLRHVQRGGRCVITSKSTPNFHRVEEAERMVDVIAVAHPGRDPYALLSGLA